MKDIMHSGRLRQNLGDATCSRNSNDIGIIIDAFDAMSIQAEYFIKQFIILELKEGVQLDPSVLE